jgi:fluoride exporter
VIPLLCVCLGAAVGAPARYLLDRAVQSRHDSVMPWGTLGVNLTGSLVLGVLAGLSVARHVPPEVVWFLGTGLCGALTTYSTFSYETLRLYESGAWPYALANVAVSLSAGLGAAFLGYAVGAAV